MSQHVRPGQTTLDSMAAAEEDKTMLPLCVDLDGTLLKTDLLHETLLLLAKRSPLSLFSLPFWLLRGRAHLKHEIALRVLPEIKSLPYRGDLLEFLRREKEQGRRLILVTATDQLIAAKVEEHLQIFDETIGSNPAANLKGAAKARVLEDRFGRKGFDYVGDSKADFAIWRVARRALVVSNSERFVRAIGLCATVEKSFPKSSGRMAAFARSIRMHQWAKNLLVFVPTVTAHQLHQPEILLRGLLAFFSFSLVSSSVYLLNDMLDLEADRVHRSKRLRPLAAGDLPIALAAPLAAVLFIAGLALGAVCGRNFLAIIAIYLAFNLAYSTWLKYVVILDVVILACFYTLRLLAGGEATGLICSEWFLAFSIFFFFCLAMIKRYSELREIAVDDPQKARGYQRSDLEAITTVGVSSGMISVLVLVLYVMNPDVRLLYQHPTVLLLLCPLFLYWISRLWFKANRGEVPQDPVLFALTDRTSYIAGILAAAILYFATF